ncbi:MAG TPA: matrixin family metalloprotease [Pyrinomonadaceae bacterium]|nr:matrixin family metalloprotease [Pyrinomonadaceae bacterium]
MPRSVKTLIAVFLLGLQVSAMSGASLLSAAERPEVELKWRAKVIPIGFSTSLFTQASNIKQGTDAVAALKRSLRVWEEAAGIEFREFITDKQSVSPTNGGDGVSLITIAATADNALLFARNGAEVAATTRLFYDPRGRITEADVVLNPYKQFSTDGTFGTFDLEATFTHEIGHVLGLEHSFIRGSAMFESFGINGLFGLHGFSQRHLSVADLTAVRAKYGVRGEEENCCGTVNVRLLFPERGPAANVNLWLEETETGRLAAQATTGTDGNVVIPGLRYGSYTVYTERKQRAKRSVQSQMIGKISISDEAPATLVKRLSAGNDEIEVEYTGFNGQLTFNSVPINAGKAYTLYVGGRNLDSKSVSIRFSTPFLELTPGSISFLDYGEGLTVLSFEVSASHEIPVGEYSVFLETPSGGRSSIPGAIAVRDFVNPYSNLILQNK